MKRKTTCFCVGVVTFMLGSIFASILVEKNKTVIEAEVPNLIEPLVAPKPIDSIYPQKSPPKKSRYLEAFEIIRFDPEFEVAETKVEDLSDKPNDFDLDLSQTIENQIIALHPYPNDFREFKIEQQFETSMSVSDEGPHWDLTDWKHYTSEWNEIKRLEGNRFLTSKVGPSDYQRFPKVTSKEISEAVSKRGGKKWADHVRSCKTATDDPCLVSISRISFRIMAKENGKWNIIHKINFFLAMGC
ncbi:MAG: hypothetical protein IPN69_21600 [Acidobacteria bacterium]|nr:hypothetical protein [Acidobacteriota bacterium]